jgi:predicted alpha/beta-fold hydrolase
MTAAAQFAFSPFRPAWWLPGPHLQTVGARLLRSRLRVPLRRERVELSDGDFLDLDFAYEPLGKDDRRPVVLLLHGLEGSARSGYAMELYRVLRQRGAAAVGLNFRSCSGEPNRLPRMYHSGDTGDLHEVLSLLATRCGGRPIGVVGVSIGGNVLLKYLGEAGEEAGRYLRGAVAVSVPFDLAAGAEHLRRPAGRPYANHLLRSLRRKIVNRRDRLPSGVDVARALAARDFREFDDAATAPLHGFTGAEDYYRRSSSGPLLGAIRVPTCILHSLDDPFVPSACVPLAAVAANPALTAAFLLRGGHVGFVAGSRPLRPVYWAEREAGVFLAGVLGQRARG